MLRVLPTTFEPVLQQIRLQGFFLPYVGGKTRNIATHIHIRFLLLVLPYLKAKYTLCIYPKGHQSTFFS